MEAYPHLRIEREQPVNLKRPGRLPRIPTPADISAHGRKLHRSFAAAKEDAQRDIGGFDERLLFKLQIGSLSPEEFEKGFPEVEVVSQEDGGYALAFASPQALEEFESRLTTLVGGAKPKYANILYALQAFERWTPDDRKGWALKRDGLPADEQFTLDVELWPVPRSNEREKLTKAFELWLLELKIEKLDSINIDSLIVYRIRATALHAEKILNHRDVRTVDLPPRFGFERQLLTLDIQDLPEIPAPSDIASVIAILDSGVAGNHPLIKPALGDAQGFVHLNRAHHDDHGHGTHVAGIALYDDIEECIKAKSFVPQLRLLSGRVLDENSKGNPRLIENIVDEAVRYFYSNYGCRIFNLSYGDMNKPYVGGRVRGLSYVLDRLSRELGVLFIVPTGNFLGTEEIPRDWKSEYPEYLFSEHARLIEPAPALNALTVGSLARWDQNSYSQRYPNDPRGVPIAQRDQPSPFTRSGMSVNKAIKPELVSYGGNYSLNCSTNYLSDQGLGELGLSKDFAEGRLLCLMCGTSFAAPHITHFAGRLLNAMPDVGSNLLRALLVANADIPSSCSDLFDGNGKKVAQTVGYGMLYQDTLYRSTEEEVTLVSEAALPDNHHHFYEIPIPASFCTKEKRRRKITVAIAHCPAVRTTRVDYKASRFEFKLVEGESLEKVVSTFNAATTKDDFPNIAELSVPQTYKSKYRSKGTVQCSSWTIRQARQSRLFVVVTRKDSLWGRELSAPEESYAIVIRLSDRENEQARLYTEIRSQLQTRERARQRARA